jgi:hypothetical protein
LCMFLFCFNFLPYFVVKKCVHIMVGKCSIK